MKKIVRFRKKTFKIKTTASQKANVVGQRGLQGLLMAAEQTMKLLLRLLRLLRLLVVARD